MNVKRAAFVICVILATASSAMAQSGVRVEKSVLLGPRPLQEQTQSAAIQNYLDAWQCLSNALEQNNPDILDRDFAGSAQAHLASAIKNQIGLGIHTSYRHASHDIQIVFYSPEGLSIELTDNVDYDVQVFDQDKMLTTKHVRARYIAVLTPAEVNWRVRLLQAETDS